MRPWFAALICALLLLQPGWASTSADGPGNGRPTAVHHCPHAHVPCDAPAATADASHADCGTCHSTCGMAVFCTRAQSVLSPTAFPLPAPMPPPASQPADLPERPQWAAAVTA